METIYKIIDRFLQNPMQEFDFFEERNALIWVDWREYDEDILVYFNQQLPEDEQIVFTIKENDKPSGIDVILQKGQLCTKIPYAEERLDRDTTLRAIQEYLAPKYQIRWYLNSLGGDTLGFCLLSVEQWQRLENVFGIEKVMRYFQPIHSRSQIFDLDRNELRIGNGNSTIRTMKD